MIDARSDGRGDPRRDGLVGAALFVFALLPRLYVALRWAGEPVWDGHYYDFGARRIAQGMGYSDDLTINGLLVWHPWCHYPVGYSAFLGLFYRAFGASTHVAAVVNASVGAGLAVVTWALARCALSRSRAILAGLLVAAHPGLVLYSALVMTEPLAALLTLLAFLVAVRGANAGKPLRAVVIGALILGLGALVRPQALLCAPFFGLVCAGAKLFKRDNPTSNQSANQSTRVAVTQTRFSPLLRVAMPVLVGGAVACTVALLPVLPWTARNCRVMDGCALVSTNAGWNLAIGAFPRATGRFETLRSSDGCREVTGQVQQDRCWLHYGLAQIEARPLRWLSLMPAKLAFTFDHESFAVEYLHEARPEAWPDDRRSLARGILSASHLAVLAGAALGCVAFVRRGRGVATQGTLLAIVVALFYVGVSSSERVFWPLAIFASLVPWLPLRGRAPWPPALLLPVALLGTTALTHAVFFGEDRYHVVVTPALCLLAACALRESAKPASEA